MDYVDYLIVMLHVYQSGKFFSMESIFFSCRKPEIKVYTIINHI